MTRDQRRLYANLTARVLVGAMAVVALVPLFLVLAFTFVNGIHTVLNPDFFLHVERPEGIPGGGVFHAIWGTVIIVGVASALAIPAGILGAVYLVEFGHNRFGDAVRMTCDALVAAPSIVIGLFAYTLFVAPIGHFSGLSGSFALAVLMLPVVIRTSEASIALVPAALRESGLALGLPRWRVSLQLVLRASVAGVVTGCLLSIARAAGETAPLLFTALGNQRFSADPSHPMAALPLIVFNDALTPYSDLQAQAWGAALLLVLLVLLVNVATRLALRRQVRLASRL